MKNNYLLKIVLVFIFLLFLLLMSCSKNESKEYNLNPKTLYRNIFNSKGV